MILLTLDNPVFAAFAISAALMVLKLMGQGWMTVYRMIKSDAGLLNPEDLKEGPFNRNPDPAQMQPNEYVDRSRRMHVNDLESIPAYLAIGLLFVLCDPPAWLAYALFWMFVAARFAHSASYVTAQRHEIRAAFFTVGSAVVIVMAIYVLGAALF